MIRKWLLSARVAPAISEKSPTLVSPRPFRSSTTRMPLIPLTDLNDTRLDPYRSLKLSNQTRTSGHLIAEGHRVVKRLVESDFAVDSILVTDRRQHMVDGIDTDRYRIYLLSDELASQLVGYDFHGGVVAAGWRRESPASSSIQAECQHPNGLSRSGCQAPGEPWTPVAREGQGHPAGRPPNDSLEVRKQLVRADGLPLRPGTIFVPTGTLRVLI